MSGKKFSERRIVKRRSKSFFDDKSEKFEFIGWIPNTTGHVYFRHATVRQGEIDRYVARPPIYKHSEGNTERYLLATSLCDMNDLKPLHDNAKFTRFIVNAVSQNKQELTGRLWMIWDKANDPTQSYFERYLVTLFEKLELCSEKLRALYAVKKGKIDYPNLSDTTSDIETTIDSRKNDFDEKPEINFIKLKKELEEELSKIRNGLQIWESVQQTENNNQKKISEFRAIQFEFSVSNTGFCYLKEIDSESKNENENEEIRIEAAYYYLKYLLHLHQHHDNMLDSFCRLHRIWDAKEAYNQYDDRYIGLAKNLLRDIKANLIELKFNHFGDEAYTRNSKGIAAYSTSLIQQLKAEKILKIKKREHEDFVNRETIYIDSLIRSIDVRQGEASAMSWSRIFGITNQIFAFVLMFIGALILLGIEIEKLKITPPNNSINQFNISYPNDSSETDKKIVVDVAASSLESGFCKKNNNYPIDYSGKNLADYICSYGASGLLGGYFALLFFAVSSAYAYIYILEKGVIRDYGFTYIFKHIRKLITPDKITLPTHRTGFFISIFFQIKNWIIFEKIPLINRIPIFSTSYYWNEKHSKAWHNTKILLAWLLFFTSSLMSSIAILTLFTFNPDEVTPELLGNKLFYAFYENISKLIYFIYDFFRQNNTH